MRTEGVKLSIRRRYAYDGVILALSSINSFEINKKILYGRMENIEQSTLIV